jgi:hypothetical protein
MTIRIEPIQDSPGADAALEALLHESYIVGGFTDPDLAFSGYVRFGLQFDGRHDLSLIGSRTTAI